ncbi:MAG: single-stranded-DNA-specific exonuclease RecJ [Patescibacteria group bacterium]|nr:single-stranded-DNA-specific exonuclease RecJ [Patescibacteria group bacterium]
MAISNGVNNKKWELSQKMPNDFKDKFPEIHPVILQLFYSRGLKTQEVIDEFLLPDYSQDLHDPFIFQDMAKAVDRIYQAIEKKEKILIYGDYDADGVTSSAVLFNAFTKLGTEFLKVYIPDREKEGYSLHKKAIEKFIEEGINLIVTCDCGTTNKEEVEQINQAKMDIIITDHHPTTQELPPAYAIINPQLPREKYPFRSLAGVGVAFKLIQALLKDKRCLIPNKESFEKWILDLVAIGTISDVMPLLGENRTLVKYGLVVLNKTSNIGLKALITQAGLTLGALDTWSVNFQIGPRINAAGRVSHANDVLNLFLETDQEKVNDLAIHLNSLNTKRQKAVDKILKDIKKSLGEEVKDKIIVVCGEDWPAGLLAIIAGNLMDKYFRPAIAISIHKEEISMRGSGRSIHGFDLAKVLEKFHHYFSHYGGHAKACGFTLKDKNNLEIFIKELTQLANDKLKDEDLCPRLSIDAEVSLSEVDWSLYDDLKKLEPFGQNNNCPNFLVSNVKLDNIESVGKTSQHSRLIIEKRKMIYFNGNQKMTELKIGDKIDVVFQLSINQWNGQQELQMKIVDIKKAN